MRCSDCQRKVRPIVAVDIDGTLAQYHRSFVEFGEQWLGIEEGSLPRDWDGIGEFRDRLGIESHLYRQMKLAFRAGGFKRWMPAFPMAAMFMQALNELGLEVWITTTRPWMRMDNVDPDTREWLRRNRVDHKHLLFDEDKYGILTELVDPERIVAVFDDEEEQRDRCAELSLPFVLRRTEWNSGVVSDHFVSSYTEAFDTVRDRVGVRDALQG